MIIPVGAAFSEELRDAVHAWLAYNLPQWVDFDIRPTGKYLGLYVGPVSANKLWTNAANKWATRAHVIGSSAIPLQLSATLYNGRSATCLGYIAQMVLPPDRLLRQERYILSKVLHLPPNSFKVKGNGRNGPERNEKQKATTASRGTRHLDFLF